jgi:2-methylcitrate dehydratase PrpD
MTTSQPPARSLAERFAAWGTSWDQRLASPALRVAARRAILDTLGVIVLGGTHDDVKKLLRIYNSEKGPCHVVNGGSATAETAALINAAAAHAWDFDDTSYTGIMHGSAVILPTVLAVAEETQSTPDDILSAFIIGSEITYVLADVCTHRHYFRGWWSTVTLAPIGATAAAARLYGCNETQIAEAIGLAAAAAGGSKAVFGTSGKPFLAGDSARRAVSFARIIKGGLRGPTQAIDIQGGFLDLLGEGSNLTEADSLGMRWRLLEPGLLFKRNPVCSAAHSAIEQMAILTSEASAQPHDIQRIDAEIPDLVNRCLVFPSPKTPQQAQFSLQYALACAALHGRVDISDLLPDEIYDPRKIELMRRVVVRVASDLSTDEMREKYPESIRLTITLTDGRQFSGFCGEAYGMPRRPLSDTDLISKFRSCVAHVGYDDSNMDVLNLDLLKLAARYMVEPRTP